MKAFLFFVILTDAWIQSSAQGIPSRIPYVSLVQRQIEIDLRRGAYCDSVRVKLEESNTQLRELVKLKDQLIDEQDAITTAKDQQISDLLKVQGNDTKTIAVLNKEIRRHKFWKGFWKITTIAAAGAFVVKESGVF